MPKMNLGMALAGSGLALSAVLAVFPTLLASSIATLVLVVIGLALAFVSISVKERIGFMLAGLVIVLTSASLKLSFPLMDTFLNGFFTNLIIVFVPGLLLVAIMHFWDVSKTPKGRG